MSLNHSLTAFVALLLLALSYCGQAEAKQSASVLGVCEYNRSFQWLGVQQQDASRVLMSWRVEYEDCSGVTGHTAFLFSGRHPDGSVDYTRVTGYEHSGLTSLTEDEAERVLLGVWEVEQTAVNGQPYNDLHLVPRTCANCQESPLVLMDRFHSFAHRTGSAVLPVVVGR